MAHAAPGGKAKTTYENSRTKTQVMAKVSLKIPFNPLINSLIQ